MNQILPPTFVNAATTLTQAWPSFLPRLPDGTALEDIWYTPIQTVSEDDMIRASTTILGETALSFQVPGLDAVSLLVASTDGDTTLLPVAVQIQPEFRVELNGVAMSLAFKSDLLRPVRKTQGTADARAAWAVDPTVDGLIVSLGTVNAAIDGDGDVTIETETAIDLPPAMIGETGIVIEAQGIALHLDASDPPPGQPSGVKGIAVEAAAVHLPGEIGEVLGPLEMSEAFIGNGGFSGSIATSFPGGQTVELFGLDFTLDAVEITFVQNALTASRIAGTIELPFFDEPVPVEIAVNLDGSFTVRLGNAASGLHTLVKPNLLEFELESLGFTVEDGLFVARMSGTIQPLAGGLDWPGFRVEELTIDSDGAVHVDGGWIDLRDQYSLNFHGFTMEITQFGLGTEDDGTRWIGVSGGLKLVEGLKAGASVRGLRISWGDDGVGAVSFDGVGVEFEVPDVLLFKGDVAYRELEVDGETVHRFDGALELELLCLDMSLDAKLVIGTADGPQGRYRFLGIYFGVDLPAGIPLWSTGLALYGMEGLFALNMEPDKQPDEPWYGLAPGEGWFKRPEVGVTDINNKWTNRRDALAVGAGITIGTLPDNGFTFNGAMLLAIVFPGPIILIEGKANILKERSSLGDDPIFRALVVLDFRAGDFLVGIDARYKFSDGAELIDISASAEMYFSFSDPAAWYFYLGQKEPRERRIRAKILSIWEANSYYMLDNSGLGFGAWTGYDVDWRFGPVQVEFEAWLETNVAVSWAPAHFHGDLWAHGKISVRVFGFGLSVDAYLEGDVFDPFKILAKLEVGVNLPWPLPDFSFDITLEWSDPPEWPLPPIPVKEVAIEHLKVGTTWPLPRAEGLLVPDYTGEDGLRQSWDEALHAGFDASGPPPENAPVVPLDCLPRITFARNVHDQARVGVMITPVEPERERIGDPAADEGPVAIKYELTTVALEAWRGGSWVEVAKRVESTGGDPMDTLEAESRELFGSWAPVPPLPDVGGQTQGQTKLSIWSKNPFDYTRRTGREWEDWIRGRYPDMPCIDIPEQTLRCWDFNDIPIGQLQTNALPLIGMELRWWLHPGDDGPLFAWIEDPDFPNVGVLPNGAGGPNRGICLSGGFVVSDTFTAKILLIALPPLPNNGVTVHCRDTDGAIAAVYFEDGSVEAVFGATPTNPSFDVNGTNARYVVIWWPSTLCMWRVCVKQGASEAQIDEAQEIAQHNVSETIRWSQTGIVLDHDTDYRLRIDTRIDALGTSPLSGSRVRTHTEYAYFRTEGPPGLANLDLPLGVPDADEASLRNADGQFVLVDGSAAGDARALDSDLNDLSLYVDQTLPVTVPSRGENRPLPRPVYRAYDLGVTFNEDYVSLMYRIGGRDLTLYVFDSNNRPIRDAAGRLISVESSWDVATDLALDHHEATWVETVNLSSCAGIDTQDIPHDETLATQGLVLWPDFVHEARLTPLLLHELFAGDLEVGDTASGSGARLGRWQVQDDGTVSAPSVWTVGETGTPPVRHVRQSANIFSQPTEAAVPGKAGTILFLAASDDLPASHPMQPENWTEYRLTVILRAGDNDALGLVFRRASASRYYRFAMDQQRSYRRLTRHLDGRVQVLGEDDFTYREDQDYTITIEAIGGRIAVYVDGEEVFRVLDETFESGGIGLYGWAHDDAVFADIRVDDFRHNAGAVYSFEFTTSVYAHFAHQLHAFQDELWSGDLPGGVLTALRDAAVPLATVPTLEEGRAWVEEADALALAALLSQEPPQLQLTRIGERDALLVQGPEPLMPNRVSLTLERSDDPTPRTGLPGKLKLTGVTRSETVANAETVSLLVREAHDPSGTRVERRSLPGPLAPPPPLNVLLEDSFDTTAGVLFEETFGPNALDLYDIRHQGAPAPNWQVAGGRIVQSANTFDGSFSAGNLRKRGTEARFGRPGWGDIELSATLNSGDDDSIGLIFRAEAGNRFLRFELNGQFGYARLVHVDGSAVRLLWSAPFTLVQDRDYALRIRVWRRHVLVMIDGHPICDVNDGQIPLRGQAGLWCWANVAARFGDIMVTSLHADPVLWAPVLDTLDGFTVLDAPGAEQGPSDWQVQAGSIVQTSNIHVPGAGPERPGTQLVGGRIWRDAAVSVRVTPGDDDGIGVCVRVQEDNTYYRFAYDAQEGMRRLIKVLDGVVTVLWQAPGGYPEDEHRITLEARGPRLSVWLSGTLLAEVTDRDIPEGRIALYSYASAGLRFDDLRVLDTARRVGGWQIVDAGTVGGPSRWRMARGQLSQLSNINGGLTDASSPVKPGTMAVRGNPGWRNLRMMAELSSDDNDAIGLVVRYRDPENYYLFAIDAQRDYRRFVRVADGEYSTLWNGSGGFVPGDVNLLSLDAVGNRFSGAMGDTVLFSVTDDTHPEGQIGLYAWGNDKARFRHVEVREPPQKARALFFDDFVGPALAPWSVVDGGNEAGPSEWTMGGGVLRQDSNIHSTPFTATGPDKQGTYVTAGDAAWTDILLEVDVVAEDDDAFGVMLRLRDDDNYYRFTLDAQRNVAQLVLCAGGVFTTLWQGRRGFEEGRRYRLAVLAEGSRIAGFLDGVLMFEVNDGTHLDGAIGLYTWAMEGIAFSRLRVYPAALATELALDEDFAVFRAWRWALTDDGTATPTRSFAVDDAGLSRADVTPESPAATVAVAGDLAWGDYRATAVLRADGPGQVGLDVRRGPEGHYRFTVGTGDQIRFSRFDGSAETNLWSGTLPIATDADLALSVDCVGTRFTLYLNAEPLAELRDADGHLQGAIGLFAGDHAGVSFRLARVGLPVWVPYYRFAQTGPLADGTRLRIHSGSAADPGTADPLEISLYATSAFEAGEPVLGDEEIDLRIVTAEGVEHRTRFLSEDSFAVVPMWRLSKADGTAMVLLAETGALERGSYRLRATFQRNASGLPVLSERGETGAEVAELLFRL